MFLVASGVDVIVDKEEVASGFKECDRMNGFKPWIRNVKSNVEKKLSASFVAVKSEHNQI